MIKGYSYYYNTHVSGDEESSDWITEDFIRKCKPGIAEADLETVDISLSMGNILLTDMMCDLVETFNDNDTTGRYDYQGFYNWFWSDPGSWMRRYIDDQQDPQFSDIVKRSIVSLAYNYCMPEVTQAATTSTGHIDGEQRPSIKQTRDRYNFNRIVTEDGVRALINHILRTRYYIF